MARNQTVSGTYQLEEGIALPYTAEFRTYGWGGEVESDLVDLTVYAPDGTTPLDDPDRVWRRVGPAPQPGQAPELKPLSALIEQDARELLPDLVEA